MPLETLFRADAPAPVEAASRARAVTLVGIMAMVLGGLVVLGSVGAGAVGLAVPIFQRLAEQHPREPEMVQFAHDLARVPVIYLLLFAAYEFVRGAGLILGGAGILKRSRRGRWLTLAMAVLSIGACVVVCGGALATGGLESRWLEAIAPYALVTCVFAGLAFTVLGDARYAREFA